MGIRILCEARADPEMKNSFGDHALQMAAAAGGVESIEALLMPALKKLEIVFFAVSEVLKTVHPMEYHLINF